MRRRHHVLRHADVEPGGWLDRTHVTLLIALVGAIAVLLAIQTWLSARTTAEQEKRVAAVDLARFSVFMHRKGCALGCPVYAVLADGKGTVRYEGVSGVVETRSLEEPLDATTARALIAAVLRARFAEQTDTWVPGRTDCATFQQGAELLQFGVTMDGTTRTLDYYAGCEPASAELDRLAREIDAVLHTTRWTGAGVP